MLMTLNILFGEFVCPTGNSTASQNQSLSPFIQCNDKIPIIGSGSNEIWIIILVAQQGYHQVEVNKPDRNKLSFFSPNDKKYFFNVMQFGPINVPLVYTDMMK